MHKLKEQIVRNVRLMLESCELMVYYDPLNFWINPSASTSGLLFRLINLEIPLIGIAIEGRKLTSVRNYISNVL